MEDKASYMEAAKKHAEKSRTASAGKFKGGLAEHSTETTALHTVSHLLIAGLREVLGSYRWPVSVDPDGCRLHQRSTHCRATGCDSRHAAVDFEG